MRVLVADDEAAIRLIVRHALDGCEVLEAEDGASAMQVLEQVPVDVMLLDVMMPGLSGFGLLARVRNDLRFRNLPVVMLTAKAGESDHVAAFRAGADAYLTKPFDIDEVGEVVHAVARRGQQERDAARKRELARAELLAQIESNFG